MQDIKSDNNNEILINAVKKLQLRFPVADIQRATGVGKGDISNFLANKRTVSDKFLEIFSEAFNIDLREFGYTKGLKKIEQTKNPSPESEGFFKEQNKRYISENEFLKQTVKDLLKILASKQ